jgi:c-di-AMP phosphodiesterase-like protein
VDKLDVQVNLTAEDIYKFQMSYLRKYFTPSLIILISVAVIYSITAAVGLITGERLFSGGVLFFLVILIFVVTVPVTLRRSAQNIYKTNKLLQKTQNYTIDEEGIEVVSENGKGEVKWVELYKAAETKESFLLFISKNQSHIIPKRFLGTSREMELMRVFMKRAPAPGKKNKQI